MTRERVDDHLCAMVNLAMATRRESQIQNFLDRTAPFHGDEQQSEGYRSQYPAAIHRPTQASYQYNCHGLTFASRRSQITSSIEVRKILTEDDYIKLENVHSVIEGDIIIYISQDNDIEHSGIVVDVPRYAQQIAIIPRILSKWGSAHEVIHLVGIAPTLRPA